MIYEMIYDMIYDMIYHMMTPMPPYVTPQASRTQHEYKAITVDPMPPTDQMAWPNSQYLDQGAPSN